MSRKNLDRKGLLLPVCGALLFLACAPSIVTMSSLPHTLREKMQTRRYDEPDSLIYSAVLGFYAERGYSFQVTDKALGLIQTEPLMYPADENRDVWTQALVGAKFRYRRRVTARVRSGTVKLSYVFESERKGRYYGESGWEIVEPDTSFSNGAYRDAFYNIGTFLGK